MTGARMNQAREASSFQPDPPIVDMSKEEAWEIARRLGFKVPGDNVLSIQLNPTDIVVTTAKTNEHGQKFIDPDNRTDIARDVYRFRYRDWAAPAAGGGPV